MVLKPSEIAPLSAYLYAEIMEEAGIPAGVFNLVNGDGPTVGEALSRHPDDETALHRQSGVFDLVNGDGPTVGEALSRHPDVDMMSFTGSTRAG